VLHARKDDKCIQILVGKREGRRPSEARQVRIKVRLGLLCEDVDLVRLKIIAYWDVIRVVW